MKASADGVCPICGGHVGCVQEVENVSERGNEIFSWYALGGPSGGRRAGINGISKAMTCIEWPLSKFVFNQWELVQNVCVVGDAYIHILHDIRNIHDRYCNHNKYLYVGSLNDLWIKMNKQQKLRKIAMIFRSIMNV